jgi:hypothetical protein
MDPLTISALIGLAGGLGGAGINALSGRNGSGSGSTPQQFGKPGGLQVYNLGGSNQARLLQAPTQTPQGMQALQMLLGQGMQGIKGMPNPQFGPIREAYEQNFRQNALPSIAERFAALGGEGAGSSSGFRATMQGAEQNLHQQLAGMEQGFNQQNMSQLMQMLGLGLTPQHENMYQPREKSWWEGLFGSLGKGIGAAGTMMGGNYLMNRYGGQGQQQPGTGFGGAPQGQ